MFLTAKKSRNARNSDIPKQTSLFSYFSLSYRWSFRHWAAWEQLSPLYTSLLCSLIYSKHWNLEFCIFICYQIPISSYYRVRSVVESPGLDVIFPRSVRDSHILLVAFTIGLSFSISSEGDIVPYTHLVGTSDWFFGSPSLILSFSINVYCPNLATLQLGRCICWFMAYHLLALTNIPGLSHECPFCLAEHSLPPPCKLSKLSVTGLASPCFLLEAAWGEYLNSLFSKTVGTTLRSSPK